MGVNKAPQVPSRLYTFAEELDIVGYCSSISSPESPHSKNVNKNQNDSVNFLVDTES